MGIQSVAHLQVLDVLLGGVEQVGADVQHTVLVVLVQVGLNHEVTHANSGTALDSHGAEDTGQTEHVLSLQERTVARTVNLYCYGVLALLVQVGSDIKLGSIT